MRFHGRILGLEPHANANTGVVGRGQDDRVVLVVDVELLENYEKEMRRAPKKLRGYSKTI